MPALGFLEVAGWGGIEGVLGCEAAIVFVTAATGGFTALAVSRAGTFEAAAFTGGAFEVGFAGTCGAAT